MLKRVTDRGVGRIVRNKDKKLRKRDRRKMRKRRRNRNVKVRDIAMKMWVKKKGEKYEEVVQDKG